MNWKNIESENDIEVISKHSQIKPQVIFKHSTTCSISLMAKQRLDKHTIEDIDFWYLDLLKLRSISNLIAEKFSVKHESPQVLVIKNGECVFDESHGAIYFEEIEEIAKN